MEKLYERYKQGEHFYKLVAESGMTYTGLRNVFLKIDPDFKKNQRTGGRESLSDKHREFGLMLFTAMEEKEMDVRQLSVLTGMSVITLNRVFRGEHDITLSQILKLEKVLERKILR